MIPDTGMRCTCMEEKCVPCNQDRYNYFQTAQYLVQQYETKKGWLVYVSPHTKRHKEYGICDDLELLIKKGKRSKSLIKLLTNVGE